MSERERLRRRLTDLAPLTASALFDLALDALDHGLFEEIVARVEAAIAAGGHRDARLWQVLGLARRGRLDGAEAHAAFVRAAALAPRDPLIAHSRARAALEAGLPAVAAYDDALALAPKDGGMLIGRAAALVAERRGAAAERVLAELLSANPGWHDGHAAYARVVAAARLTGDGVATVRAALGRISDDPALWRTLVRLLLDARRYAEAGEAAQAAAARLGAGEEWRRVAAAALSEAGDPAAAQALFDALPAPTTATALTPLIRTLIRLDRLEEASALAERIDDRAVWPYRALLWRVTGDPRWAWLEGDPRLIGVYDVGLSAAEMTALAEVLGALHGASGELTDQSVRGGSQTDGQLLARAEPEIRRLRDALVDAVRAHVAQLPPADARHPTLTQARAPLRIAGSWSVRLSGAGFHVDHVHPLGWLSSAFYVSLPEGWGRHEGWLAFGECRDLLPRLEAFRLVEPKVGRLVLFPSTMWHGTRPFAAGERMTVAFDIAPP